jgi:hypothetical protein
LFKVACIPLARCKRVDSGSSYVSELEEKKLLHESLGVMQLFADGMAANASQRQKRFAKRLSSHGKKIDLTF